ncbi:MAG: hypothetical protein Q4F84_08195 [Fibrobacter sp.]|nr:hypothetical protein [Fibrobacter sp.]
MARYRFVWLMLISGLLVSCKPPHIDSGEPETEQVNRKDAKQVSVEWKPNLGIDDFNLEPLEVYKEFVVEIPVIADERENRAVFGKILEDQLVADKYIPLYTNQNVSKWLTQAVINALNFFGIRGVSKKGSLVVENEVSNIFLADDSKQRCDISFRVNVRSGEMLVWEGAISGNSELYSHPDGSDGISECLSNTVLRTVYNMLTDNSFRDAVISVK